jgi:hypothetical protein
VEGKAGLLGWVLQGGEGGQTVLMEEMRGASANREAATAETTTAVPAGAAMKSMATT